MPLLSISLEKTFPEDNITGLSQLGVTGWASGWLCAAGQEAGIQVVAPVGRSCIRAVTGTVATAA